MGNRRSQINVAHTLTTNFSQRNFNTTFFTNDTLVLHTLVLATQTFVILDRTENLGTEQTVFFRFERTVVNCFRFFHLTV